MIDRLSTFSDPEIIELLGETFVPATDNDWYNRRREDAAGEFFREVARQGPRGEGSGTKQGHYILTASGKLLGFNNNRSIERRRAFIRDALAKWRELPETERRPGAVEVPPLDQVGTDARYHAEPPAGAVVLVASARLLKRAGEGYAALARGDQEHGWGHLAAIDRMWIKPDEWRSLVETGEGGAPLPSPVAHRLIRFHLTDYTRGEPPFWRLGEIRSQDLRIDPGGAPREFVISGGVELATDDGSRGFDVSLYGEVVVGGDGRPQRFDLVALGDHWGEGRYTGGARPGKNPLGIAFRLGDPSKPTDRIRPQASHHLDGYYRADR